MASGLEALANMRYPGRFIVIGLDRPGNAVVVYGITGRSASSQARRLVYEEGALEITGREALSISVPAVLRGDLERVASAAQAALVKGGEVRVWPTDKKELEKGNPALLIYPAIVFSKRGVAVSNGLQTTSVYEGNVFNAKPTDVLMEGLKEWRYEPDAPHFTPRIAGVLNGRGAALAILRKGKNDSTAAQYFEVPLENGKGKLISTYAGADGVTPLPSFVGAPIDVLIDGSTPEEVSRTFYDALAPPNGSADYRVSVAALFFNGETLEGKVVIVNRHGDAPK